MRWRPVYRQRARIASLDKGLVLATWWLLTRAMVIHGIALGFLLTFSATDSGNVKQTPSYNLILHWAPLPVWGAWITCASFGWWIARGRVCLIFGIAVAMWFFAFGCAFFVAWVVLVPPNTTVTAWATYLLIGWAWMVITYVGWKDQGYVEEEQKQVRALEQAVEALNDHQPKE